MPISYQNLMTMQPQEYAFLAGQQGYQKKNITPLGMAGPSVIASENQADFMTERYRQRVERFGAKTSAAILEASPYLRAISNYLQARFEAPIPEPLAQGYREQIRSAQAARGFSGGGTAVTGEEARYLYGMAESQRRELAPMVANFGQTMLGMGGMGGANRPMSPQEIEQIRIQDMLAREQRKTMKSQRALSVAQTAMQGVSMVASMVGGGFAGMAMAQAGQAAGGQGPGAGMGFALGAMGQAGTVGDIYQSSAAQNMFNQYMTQLKSQPSYGTISPNLYGGSNMVGMNSAPATGRQFQFDFLNTPYGGFNR